MDELKLTHLICKDAARLKGQVVSIIGGGGKSTLMLALSKNLGELGLKVVVTSTTKFQIPHSVALVLQNYDNNYLQEAKTILKELNVVAIAQDHYSDKSRLLGVNRFDIAHIKQLADVVLIEADGSRQRGLKTHKDYEPVIPAITHTTVIVVSAEIVGKPLGDKYVHRATLFSRKWELPLGSRLTPEIIARELLSPYSYLKNVPINSNVTYYINKVDKNAIGGKLLAERLARNCNRNVFLGSLKNNQLKRISIKSK